MAEPIHRSRTDIHVITGEILPSLLLFLAAGEEGMRAIAFTLKICGPRPSMHKESF